MHSAYVMSGEAAPAMGLQASGTLQPVTAGHGAAWRDDRIADGHRVDDAEYWLDVVFAQPCPEDWPTGD